MPRPSALPCPVHALDFELTLARLLRLVGSHVSVVAEGTVSGSAGARVSLYDTLTRAQEVSSLFGYSAEVLLLHIEPGGASFVLRSDEFERAIVVADGAYDPDLGDFIRLSTGLAVTIALDTVVENEEPMNDRPKHEAKPPTGDPAAPARDAPAAR